MQIVKFCGEKIFGIRVEGYQFTTTYIASIAAAADDTSTTLCIVQCGLYEITYINSSLLPASVLFQLVVFLIFFTSCRIPSEEYKSIEVES